MSSEPPPNNGFYPTVAYNPSFFASQTSSSAGGATETWVEENSLEKTGNPTDQAQTTTFEGQIICTNTTGASNNTASILSDGGITCSDIYLTNGNINGNGAYLFTGSEDVQIGNQNNATVSVAILQANNAGYGINSAGVINAGTNITAGQNITANGNVQGYYVTATEALVSENIYESVTGTGTGYPTVYGASPNVSIAGQANTINLGISAGSTPQNINCGSSAYNATTMNLYGMLNMFGALNINQAVSVFSGGTNYKSGQVYISMPFQGQSFKIAIIVANNLQTTGSLTYTYNYPTPFTTIISMIFPDYNLYPSGSSPDGLSMSASSTLTTLTFSVIASSTNNGIILLVGR